MSSPLSAAEAWALAAKVYAVDALHIERNEGRQTGESIGTRCVAHVLLAHAHALDDSDDLVLRAQEYMERKVKPAAHYAPKRKPTRRRGTKPASLPQLLSEAARAIKEP